jgi:C1A family cysteine protease
MKTFALAALGATAIAADLNSMDIKFINYIAEHNKYYGSTDEFNFRQQVWAEKEEFINQHNSEGHTWTLGHNHLSDWTPEEYKVLLGYKPELRTAQYEDIVPTPYVKSNSAGVDWRTKGAVTAVKDQGSCGSCWSFSTTGALEGAHFIASGNLESYSEMQFVNCDFGLTKNLGCNGGLMDKAFTYAEKTAITTEEAYPYTPKKGSCDTSKLEGASLKVSTFVDVETNNPDALKAQLDKGPVSVAIEADKMVFQTYKSGVITGDKCGTNLDHGVLAVGYGTDSNGVEYYIVKNSWAATWGDKGYVNIGVEDGAGVCGIQSGPPSQPTTN